MLGMALAARNLPLLHATKTSSMGMSLTSAYVDTENLPAPFLLCKLQVFYVLWIISSHSLISHRV